MNELAQVLKDYLETPDTDYAIMVSGDWGCGKSYYISHTFMDQVTKIRVPKGEGCYRPAFISLYGVSSVGDFEYRVFSGINQWTNNKLIRVLGTVGSKLVEAKGGSADKKGLEAITFIDTNRVLIFDDLERICEDKIPVKEVLGLINTYSEHSHFKVIIVCNEKHYLSDDVPETLKADYIKYKEKSVRFTYLFVSDINAIYDVMVSGLPENDYKDYLNKEKASILSIFKLGGENNLRTLKFFIDTFNKVFNIAKKAHHAPEVIRIYQVSYMLYMIENKQGLTSDELYNVEVGKFSKYFREQYETVYEEFRSTPLLVDFIETGYLDESSFKEEVDRLNAEIDKQIETPEGRVYHQLTEMTELRDEEVDNRIKELMSYVAEDRYSIKDLMDIYYLLLKYEFWGINGFTVTKSFEKEFLASMERQQERHDYDAAFAFNLSHYNQFVLTDKQNKKYDVLVARALEINSAARESACIYDFHRFVEVVEKEDIEGLRQLMADPEEKIKVSEFDWKKVVDLMLSSSNPMAFEICNFIKFLFPDSDSHNSAVRKELLPELDKYLSSNDGRMRRIHIRGLRKHLFPKEAIPQPNKRSGNRKK